MVYSWILTLHSTIHSIHQDVKIRLPSIILVNVGYLHHLHLILIFIKNPIKLVIIIKYTISLINDFQDMK